MDETLMKIRILAKAESTLLKANARRTALRARLFAMAIGLGMLTVVMINLAAYQYLSQTLSEAQAALIIGLFNAALAVVVIILASRVQPGPEEAMVQDIREMVLTELSADMDTVKNEFAQIGGDLQNIKSGVSKALGIFKGGGSGLGSTAQALGLITTMLKK